MVYLCAFILPFVNALQLTGVKVLLLKDDVDDKLIILAPFLCTTPILFGLLLFDPVSIDLSWRLILILLGLVACELPAQWYYHQAIKLDKFGYVLPVLSLKLVFLTIISAAFFELEGNQVVGLFGILVVLLGSVALQLEKQQRNIKEWVHLLSGMWSARPTRYAFVVAVLWSLTTSLQSAGSRLVGPILFGFLFLFFCLLGFGTWTLLSIKHVRRELEVKTLGVLGLLALIQGGILITQYWCLSLMSPAYFMAVKETTIFWSILCGRLFLHEFISWRELMFITLISSGAILVVVASQL